MFQTSLYTFYIFVMAIVISERWLKYMYAVRTGVVIATLDVIVSVFRQKGYTRNQQEAWSGVAFCKAQVTCTV
ncbi:hypothetical protein V8C43DRAFT_299316, partial [Trichoderma afarasin]